MTWLEFLDCQYERKQKDKDNKVQKQKVIHQFQMRVNLLDSVTTGRIWQCVSEKCSNKDA